MEFQSIFLLLVAAVVCVQTVSVEEEARNSTAFTLDFYRSSFDPTLNTVISPMSFRILLSLLYQSTIGDTHQELKNYGYFADDAHETADSQLLTINSLIANPNVKIVNKVYVKQNLRLLQSFEASARNYHSAVEQKDFTKSQQTANEINQFVEEQTNGLIKNLVSSQNFDGNTILLLLNTLYFKADWASQFKKHSTRSHIFKRFDGSERSTDFMVATRQFQTYDCSTLKSIILELPYVPDSNSKFWIILPHEDSNINELKSKLSPAVLTKIQNKLTTEFNTIWVPIFEIESSIDGVTELKKLGINSLFEKSEIIAAEGTGNLKVSSSKQKAKIIVNTKGTEAAAATYMEISRQSLFISNNAPLIVDRPFIYMILTVDSSEPLFIGHFSGPN